MFKKSLLTFTFCLTPLMTITANQNANVQSASPSAEAQRLLVENPINLKEYLASLSPAQKEQLRQDLQKNIVKASSGVHETGRDMVLSKENEAFLGLLAIAWAGFSILAYNANSVQLSIVNQLIGFTIITLPTICLAVGADEYRKNYWSKNQLLADKEALITISAKLLELL